MKILVINGPNLNMLGIREPDVYGHDTYEDLVRMITDAALGLGVEIEVFQSNHEGALVDKIQSAYGDADAIVINPAAYTHTSVAILDALKAVSLPAVESVFESHPFVSRARVETCGGDVVRLGALVVLSPEGAKALAAGTCAAVASRLRQDLRASVGDAAFPRRLRFVRELPCNEQGKVTAAAVREVLSAWCAEPATLAWEESAGTLTARFAFPSDLTCFKGHFLSFAILPGVAQMYFVRHFARQAFPDYPDACVFRRLKFQKIVVPNAEVTLTVTRQGSGSFSFSLTGPTGPCASGLVERISE